MSDRVRVELIRQSRVHWEEEVKSEVPNVEIAPTAGISDYSMQPAKVADACIYCGSTTRLSREHILAYALGGTRTIPRGSCEDCRRITHGFETVVLRGPMQMVRYIQGIQSRTKHQETPKTVSVKIIFGGGERTIEVPRAEAPILLPFPVFGPPGYFESNRSALTLVGVVGGSFGADPKEFAKAQGASGIELKITGTDGIAFARLLAKTAYANAFAQNYLEQLEDASPLVRAMMYEPDTIGRFVGTVPPPHKQYPGLQHRIATEADRDRGLLLSTVQLFAGAGAPSYIVVLGTLKGEAGDAVTES